MDDIQNCVQDAVYGDALDGGASKPRERLAIPPSNFDFEAYKKKHNLETGQDIFGCPLGAYLLNKYLKARDDKSAQVLVDIDELLAGGHVTKKAASAVMAKNTSSKLLDTSSVDDEINKLDNNNYRGLKKLIQSKFQEAIAEASTKYYKEFQASPAYNRFLNVHWALTKPLDLDSIIQYRDLGRGAFGAVAGCAIAFTGKMFAIKIMNRKQIKGKKALKLTINEKMVLAALGDNPSQFCIYLRHSFYDANHLYFILPLLSGGDLNFHLKEAEGRKFDKARAQFYTLEVAKGLMHLHKMGYVYRDMKPENVLLATDGHACISDLGLAAKLKRLKSNPDELLLKGRAGTPGYWPPEMLSGGKGPDGEKLEKLPYDVTCDYWSLACMLYEMLTGYCPYTALNTKRFKKDFVKDHDGNVIEFESGAGSRDKVTKNWRVLYCNAFDDVTTDLLDSIFKKDRKKRLGFNAKEFMKHDYFKKWYKLDGWKHSGEKIVWDAVFPSTFTAPWTPSKTEINAADQGDIENRNNEQDWNSVVLDAKDDPKQFYYSSLIPYQRDICPILDMEDNGELDHLTGGRKKGCCIVQ